MTVFPALKIVNIFLYYFFLLYVLDFYFTSFALFPTFAKVISTFVYSNLFEVYYNIGNSIIKLKGSFPFLLFLPTNSLVSCYIYFPKSPIPPELYVRYFKQIL